jgi:uncharacterized SAM-binding protein YcdF (DUF218 family)
VIVVDTTAGISEAVSSPDDVQAAEYIVCFGSHSTDRLSARVQHACKLFLSGAGKAIIFTGDGRTRGASPQEQTEAAKMGTMAISLGVSPASIWLEESSNDTWQNVEFVRRMLLQLRSGRLPDSIMAVTCPYHIERVKLLVTAFFAGVDVRADACRETGTTKAEIEKERRHLKRARMQLQRRN